MKQSNNTICTQDETAVRLLSDKCFHIELKLVSAQLVMLELSVFSENFIRFSLQHFKLFWK